MGSATIAFASAGLALCIASLVTGCGGPLPFVGFGLSMLGLCMSVALLVRSKR
mgnify:CR=1 FL=1